jgi:putative endonuclease
LFPCEGRGPDPGWHFSDRPAKLQAMKAGYVYIMASSRNGTLYIGVTSDLAQRVWQHREGLVPGFTHKHNCKILVWYEAHADIQGARLRELQMKKWKRQWKLSEIERTNSSWEDLYLTLSLGS